jgi:Fe-S cluster assembly protein SufD
MTQMTDHYLAQHESFARSRAGDPGWLNGLRRTGAERFAELGFPTTRQEAWKYTNVAPIPQRFHIPDGTGLSAPVRRRTCGPRPLRRDPAGVREREQRPGLSTRLDLPAGSAPPASPPCSRQPGLVELYPRAWRRSI